MMDLYAAKHSDIDIQRLKEYAFLRIEHCPLIESKTFCSVCRFIAMRNSEELR